MRPTHPLTRSSANFFSLLLSYLMAISLCAPFALKRAIAAPSDSVSKGTALITAAAARAARKKGPRRDNQLLVRFREDATEQQKNDLVGQRGGRRARRLKGRSRIEKLELQRGMDMDAVADELRQNPLIELVEPNFLLSRDQLTTPGDPRFSEQWALHNTGSTGGQPGADIQAMSAWETTTGASTTVIAVIDSGIDFTHPDLINNQWTNKAEQENNRDDDNNGLTNDLHGWDWVANSGIIRDEQGHGTAVAGIIAAQGNNSVGITGVMWRASLMSLRVLDSSGTGEVADAVEAIDYASEQGAQVINCSWGTDEESLALKDAIERAGKSGVVVVSSAGNDSRDIDNESYYPSSFGLSNQIVVASTDNFDHLASWSNYGAKSVTVAAPGKDILTTRRGGDYTTVTGTSASTPLVTGVAGLIKTQRWWLSAAGTRNAIVDGARHVAELNNKVSSGGVVSASGALGALHGPNTPPPGSGNGNNGNNGNGAGNGNGNNPPAHPPTPGHGSGGNGQDGGFSNAPPPTTNVLPGTGNINLDVMRRARPQEPKARTPIQADLCPDCDPGGGTPPSAGGSDPYFATARSRPENETGESGVDLGSRNFNWGLPLVSLPGRAGMDLNLAITYNSLVWTKQSNSIMFNADHGFPSPGFRLGVPVLETKHVNQDEVVTAYMLVMPSGQRVELPQVGTSNVYEAQDSSYIQLIDSNLFYGGSAIVRTTDGTQFLFNYPPGVGAARCTQIKDRNGNFISISYNSSAQISTLTDTLGRIVTFNYSGDFLNSITQTWNGQTHVWATFSYGSVAPNTNFPTLYYFGPLTPITVLNRIDLDDGSYYTFNYTSWLQVYKITHYAPNGAQLSYTSYNLPLNNSVPQSDCPRFTERRDWATHWNNDQEVVTTFSVDPNSAGGNQPAWSQVQTPDGTRYIEFYATTGWQKGLTTASEVWVLNSSNVYVKAKWTTTAWTQDDNNLTYQKNPRPYDMSVYDAANNRRHTDITYTSYGLPYEVREYSADGSGYGGFMRRTYTDYRFDSAYIDRRIIGLVSAVHVRDENDAIVTKITYDYDRGGEYLAGTPAAASQHDAANYGTGFVYGRGNQTDVWRWNVNDVNNATKAIRQQHTGYNINGNVVFSRDALWSTSQPTRQTSISYADSFSDGINTHNTFAYPSTVTDADGYSSTIQYDYNFGAVTRSQDPKGAAASMEYDAARRPTRVTNLVNNAYKRWVYADGQDYTLMFETIKDLTQEYFSFTWNDGAGRIHGAGGDLPNSVGGYTVQKTVYDIMGRAIQSSNPTEITGAIIPAGDDAAAGFVWTQQQYDWKGRPTLTTNPDGTTREASYTVCGCAGSDAVTVKDERGRRRRLTNDIVGRLKKVEELNWDQSVYSTTNYTYNGRDQITSINQAGQVRSFEYTDGYGRLTARVTPEQGRTTYLYFDDDTMNIVTDARGATTTFAYNGRHQPTSIAYGVPAGVAATANVAFTYDEAGNRMSMTDGLGGATYHYDQLSRMDSETRTFTGTGSYTLNYAYNLSGELTGMTGPTQLGSVNVGYAYDYAGRMSAVTGSGYAGVSSYVSSLGYRAFGGIKQIGYGNSRQLSVQYDNRLRMTNWTVAGVLGYQYAYNYYGENTNRVTFASSTYDHTLDRSFDYDHVGRMWASYSGREARYSTGQEAYSGSDGPYAQNQYYDVWGNTIQRSGWGGWNATEYSSYTNNRRNDLSYDAAGNLTWSGSTMTYDATGQQASDVYSTFDIHNSYDGDRLRVKKLENTVTTYYLRSSVLGGQVIAELSGTGTFKRGYVYLGGQMVAMQENNQVKWVHQDPIVKSQRFTDSSGNVVSAIELDPWGGETNRSSTPSPETHRFTTYERDVNGRDQAMMRQLHTWFRKFDQPDPYDGSYDFTNPQSFNRYSYVQNDPVNFVDPTGLMDDECDPITGKGCEGGYWGVVRIGHRDPWAGEYWLRFAMNSRFRGYDGGTGRERNGGTPQETNVDNNDPCAIETQLPEVGPGYVAKANTQRTRQYGTAYTVLMLVAFAVNWTNMGHGLGYMLRIGEMSIKGGGQFGEHSGEGHKIGTTVDIGLFNKDLGGGATQFGWENHDLSKTRDLINHLLRDPSVAKVISGDKSFDGRDKYQYEGRVHRNHIHVEFVDPCH